MIQTEEIKTVDVPKSKMIDKNTVISIGLFITILAAAITFTAKITTLENTIQFHIDRPDLHEGRFEKLEKSFLQEKEFLLLMRDIERRLNGIEKEILEYRTSKITK